MDQYIKTVISVGGSAIMLVMIVCVIWYVVKDTWKDINHSSKDSQTPVRKMKRIRAGPSFTENSRQ